MLININHCVNLCGGEFPYLSGTTCVAAKQLQRNFIGFEIKEEYYKNSIKRLNGILANGQTSIFMS